MKKIEHLSIVRRTTESTDQSRSSKNDFMVGGGPQKHAFINGASGDQSRIDSKSD